MHLLDGRLVLSATDLANFLACRHKTTLDLAAARGGLAKPVWVDPSVELLRRRGEEHERRYVETLKLEGLTVVDLREVAFDERFARTLQAMNTGADVIVQAALDCRPWIGFADVLRKTRVRRSKLGNWAYEAHDTKLARETRAGTIVQLCVYSELLTGLQGFVPERFHVVTPVAGQSYRFSDFAAFHRQIKTKFVEFTTVGMGMFPEETYPEPVEHCEVCRWSSRCLSHRRRDDHLSFVAGLGRQHRIELHHQGIITLSALSAMPVPIAFKPKRGASETYVRLREQARLQVVQRESGQPTYELLPAEPGFGLARLPDPRPGDLFLDLEGDPFGRPTDGTVPGAGSREYLFGLGRVMAGGSFDYTARWAITDAEERTAFEAVMAEIGDALASDPAIHVYHYAPYEPSAFKRLMGRYATHEAEVDRLLRGKRFVDFMPSPGAPSAPEWSATRSKMSSRSTPSSALCRFAMPVVIGRSSRWLSKPPMRAFIPAETRSAVEGYNRDDCRSHVELRNWLEQLRAGADRGGRGSAATAAGTR